MIPAVQTHALTKTHGRRVTGDGIDLTVDPGQGTRP